MHEEEKKILLFMPLIGSGGVEKNFFIIYNTPILLINLKNLNMMVEVDRQMICIQKTLIGSLVKKLRKMKK